MIVACLAMLLVVLCSGWVARLLPVPVPLPLVQIGLGGIAAAFTDLGVNLDPDVFFLVFLPPLLFLDGWRVPKDGLVRDARIISELALGLVVFSVIGTGVLLHWIVPGMPLPVAFALAAALSPTDPVAVSAIFKRSPIPPRLQHILEGESLLNDASGLVCMRFAVAAVVGGGFSLFEATTTFLWVASAGIAAGLATTFGATLVQRAIARRVGEETGSMILGSLLIPFGAYLLAEELGASGILAAVAAGVAMAQVEQTGRALPATRMRRVAVWDMVSFALNGAMFVLLGEQLPTIAGNAAAALRQAAYSPFLLVLQILATTLALILLRLAWVWLMLKVHPGRLTGHHRRAPRPDPGEPAAETVKPPSPEMIRRGLLVASFAGVRGSITLAGILTLPLTAQGAPFPARDLAIAIAAGTVILSITVAGIALPRLVRGLETPAEDAGARAERRARTAASLAAIDAIERALHDEHSVSTGTVAWMEAAARVSADYRARIDGMAKSGGEAEEMRRAEAIDRDLRLTGLRAERETYFRLGRQRKLSDHIVRRLVAETDQAETRLAPASL